MKKFFLFLISPLMNQRGEITVNQFTSSEQFFEASHSALEAYEKETDTTKKEDILKLAKSHTAKGKELLAKEKESRGQFKIPDTYKTKPWASKIKSEEDLYKQLDNLDSVVGKKDVPFDYANAKPEEIEAHLAVRRPGKPEDYKIGTEEEAAADPEYINSIKGLFHKAGIEQFQAEKLYTEFSQIEKARREKAFDADAYEGILKETFGSDYKREAGISSNLLSDNVTPEEKEFFDKAFPNKHAAFVHKLLNKIIKQYGIKEGDKGGGGNRGGGNNDDLEKKITEKRNEIIALKSKPHTEEQRSRLVAELTALTEKKLPKDQK